MTELHCAGKNCWRVERADFVSILVDYGNYYRDLHESICKAQHSIFLLGWDIDSRIELLRGEDAEKSEAPASFFELICWKAKKNSDVQIYLNKWDYSVFFMRQREPFWDRRWTRCDLPNIHHCLDDVLPLGACHHQKLAIIDDEVAYWGGMDIALARWDFREHHPDNPHRADPAPLPHPGQHEHFAPYHDIQAVMSGPAATALAELARLRWNAAGKPQAIPIRQRQERGLPQCWPTTDPPDFENVDMAIARTLPKTHAWKQTEEIAALLPAEIATAEKFIYIENQFLADPIIAAALNARLREKPELRVLAVSCYNPQGIFERKAMWGGRVRFRDAVESGGVADRIALAYPTSHENGKDAVVRVHSKLLIVDDKLMHIGSANINRRSMGMDTECDCTIIGEEPAARAKIAAVRTDLIREHTGYDADFIDDIINNGGSVKTFLQPCEGSRQSLKEINDEQYRHEKFIRFVTIFADPRHPLVPQVLTRLPRFLRFRVRGRTLGFAAILLALMVGIGLLWQQTPLAEYVSEERLTALMRQIQDSPVAPLWVLGIYILGGLVFLPVTALSAAVVLVFGGVKGLALALGGSVASGAVGYAIGRLVGQERLSHIFPRMEKVAKRVRNSGTVGVAVIRTLPIAPYSLMNLVFGVVGVSFFAFIAGTVLGLLPGKIMLAIFGQSLGDVIKNPDLKSIMYALLGLIAWFGVAFACNKGAKAWEARHGRQEA